MTISRELLDVLVCPKCKGELKLRENEDGLVCNACMLLYPIEEDIPVMLVEEASKIGEEETK